MSAVVANQEDKSNLQIQPFTRLALPSRQTIDEILLFLIFLACSIPARYFVGPYVMGFAEPATLIFLAWRFLSRSRSAEKKISRGSILIIGFWIATIWIAFLWVLANNWNDRREGLLGWALAAALLTVLLTQPPKNWKRVAFLFVLASFPNLIAAAYQRLMGIGLGPKDLTGWYQGGTTKPVMGFFGHPNDFAVYLYWPFLLSIGLAIDQTRWRRVFLCATTLYSGLMLFWSLSRTILATLCFVALFTLFLLLIRKRRIFVLAASLIFGAAVIAVLWVIQTHSAAWINDILSGRPYYWQLALQSILSDPLLMPLGYLAIPPPGLALLWAPHNIYILAWLNYGVVGLLLLVSLAGYILHWGWQRYDALRKNAPAALLWVGMAGLFLVNGLASLYFQETYILLTFVSVLAIWIGLQNEANPSDATLPATRLSVPSGS